MKWKEKIFYSKFYLRTGKVPGNFHIVIPNHLLKIAYHTLRDFVLKELETQRDEGINVILHRVQLIETP